jgi:aspartate/tyrosine/aromatic aminotransferase
MSILFYLQEKHLFPLLDYAYLGLVSGDIDQDAFAVRHFVSQGIELGVSQSFAKNFGLYCMFLKKFCLSTFYLFSQKQGLS